MIFELGLWYIGGSLLYLLGTMQGHKHSKGMSKSEMGLRRTSVRVDGNRHGMGRVGEGRAYGVPEMEFRFEVRMENRKEMDTKQGS